MCLKRTFTGVGRPSAEFLVKGQPLIRPQAMRVAIFGMGQDPWFAVCLSRGTWALSEDDRLTLETVHETGDWTTFNHGDEEVAKRVLVCRGYGGIAETAAYARSHCNEIGTTDRY